MAFRLGDDPLLKAEMRAVVHFKGGPLGGEVREFPFEGLGTRIAIPSYEARSPFVSTEATSLSAEATFYTELYDLRPIGPTDLEATWVNPVRGLTETVSRYRDEMAEAQRLVAEKTARIEELEGLLLETYQSLTELAAKRKAA